MYCDVCVQYALPFSWIRLCGELISPGSPLSVWSAECIAHVHIMCMGSSSHMHAIRSNTESDLFSVMYLIGMETLPFFWNLIARMLQTAVKHTYVNHESCFIGVMLLTQSYTVDAASAAGYGTSAKKCWCQSTSETTGITFITWIRVLESLSW